MDKRKKILIVSLLVVVFAAFIFWPKPLLAAGAGNTDLLPDDVIIPDKDDVIVPDPKDNDTALPKPTFPLKKGSSGTYVKNLQTIINFNDSAYNLTGGKYLVVDGKFGPATEARLIKVFGSPTVNEKQYLDALDKLKKNIPHQSRMSESFPLYKASYGAKVAKLNEKLGAYPLANPYGKNFTAKTESALKAKYGVTSTSADLYNRIVGTPVNVWG